MLSDQVGDAACERQLAAQHRLPAIYQWDAFVATGGSDQLWGGLEDVYREAGHYTARVLQGERPADPASLQPTKFQLAINMKTAGDLGLSIPPTLLALADEVIEYSANFAAMHFVR